MRSKVIMGVAGAVLLAALAYYTPVPNQQQWSANQVERLRMQATTVPDARQQLRKLAEQGNLHAQRAMAGLQLTDADASHWPDGVRHAQTAALRGDREALFLLGQAWFNGRANPTHMPDHGRARHWFEMAAEQGHGKAQYWLGLIYKSGYGIAADPQRAARWLERAARQNDADAMFMLGNLYAQGEGVARNEVRARELYQTAAAMEHPLAAQTLAYALQQGQLGLMQDEDAAEEMRHQAGEHAEQTRR